MNPDRPNENAELEAAQHTNRSSSQFSIRALMIGTALVAVLCCIFFVVPDLVGSWFMLIATLLFMPAILAALVYGNGRTRAFAVGASPPMCILLLLFTGIAGRGLFVFGFGNGGSGLKTFFAVATLVVVASGFVAQAVRWWCLRRAN